jgi:hypothetical protein
LKALAASSSVGATLRHRRPTRKGAALCAKNVKLAPLPAEAIQPVPAGYDDRRTSWRETTGERRGFAGLRREHKAAAAQPTQSDTAARAMREKLHHRGSLPSARNRLPREPAPRARPGPALLPPPLPRC